MPRSFMLLSIFLSCAARAAEAHSPYFSAAETITLPDGERGELRLLHGDGIFWAAPIRVIAIDNAGRMIARSDASPSMAFSCANASCRVLDLARDIVLELDPDTFRKGPVVPAVDDEQRSKNWELFGSHSDEGWGWRTRPADLFEQFLGTIALAMRLSYSVVFTLIAGFVPGSTILLWRTERRPLRQALVIVRALALGLLVLLSASAALASFYFSVALTGATFELWLAAFAVGAGVPILARGIASMMFGPPAPSACKSTASEDPRERL
ncbi:hypothetical protein [Methylosinus sp. RM1]|uniref:hypothetical protein n=1 Tax=Methylosinus sp. RM1 TaxID=2583817 RepID=UPI001408AC0A|nr:hypothetical protein [Methylosinus sp. RM1]